MAESLYKRQGVQITQNPIVEPQSVQIDTSVFDKSSKFFGQVAQDNLVIGTKLATKKSILDAYNAAPNDINKFNELADSSFGKQIEVVPSVMKDKLLGVFEESKFEYEKKIISNYENQLENQRELLATQDISVMSSELKSNASDMYRYLVNSQEEEASGITSNMASKQKILSQYALMKKRDGSDVFDRKDRERLTKGIFGQHDAFYEQVNTLSRDGIDSFNKNVFSNSEKYMSITGIGIDEYEKQRLYIEKRKKILDKMNDDEVKNQAEWAAAKNITSYNSDEMNELKKQGYVNSDLLDAIEKIAKKPASVYQTESAGTMEQALLNLSPFIHNATDEKERITKATDLLKNFAKFSNDAKMTEEEQRDYLSLISKTLSNPAMADAIKPIFADTALNLSLFKGMAKQEVTDDNRIKNFGNLLKITSTSGSLKDEIESSERTAKNIAIDGMRQILSTAISGNIDGAVSMYSDLNKNIIKAKISPFITSFELDDLEKKFKNGEKAIWTAANGKSYEFYGYGNKTILFKELQ